MMYGESSILPVWEITHCRNQGSRSGVLETFHLEIEIEGRRCENWRSLNEGDGWVEEARTRHADDEKKQELYLSAWERLRENQIFVHTVFSKEITNCVNLTPVESCIKFLHNLSSAFLRLNKTRRRCGSDSFWVLFTSQVHILLDLRSCHLQASSGLMRRLQLQNSSPREKGSIPLQRNIGANWDSSWASEIEAEIGSVCNWAYDATKRRHSSRKSEEAMELYLFSVCVSLSLRLAFEPGKLVVSSSISSTCLHRA
jgi:hypothetical protein